MKTIITFLIIFLLVSTANYADVYIKGILHFEGGYRYGINVPEADVTLEWWVGKNKVTFISTGWRFILDDVSGNNDWRFTLDKEKKCIIASSLKEKFYIEVPLPMNLLSHIDQSLAEILKPCQINGSIKRTGRKKFINQRTCDVYEVSEWLIYQKAHFYDRDRIVMATTDVPFDWQLVNELYQWIRSFLNPQESCAS